MRTPFRLALVAVLALSSLTLPAGPAHAATYLNPRLAEAESVPGQIVDLDATRILSLDRSASPAVLRVWDRLTNTLAATIALLAGADSPQAAGLTPRGVIFYSGTTVSEWIRTTGVISRTYGYNLAVRSPFAVWANGAQVLRRDLRDGRTVVVGTDRYNGFPDVAADGDVVYNNAEGVVRARDGVTERVGLAGGGGPLTDGSTVLYGNSTTIRLDDGEQDVPISSRFSGHTPGPNWDYAVAGGWAAYRQPRYEPCCRYELFRRSPTGATALASDAVQRSVLFLALDRSGAIAYRTDYPGTPEVYLSVPGSPSVLLASDLAPGFSKFVNGRLNIVLGDTLYVLSDAVVRLRIAISGNGAVSVNRYGQTCRVTCTLLFPPGVQLDLTASADLPGNKFRGFGGDCSGTTCRVRLEDDVSVSAEFYAADTIPPTVTAPLAGLAVGRQVGTGVPGDVPVLVWWTAVDPNGTVAATELQASTGGGAFVPVTQPTATSTSAILSTVPGGSYAVRARATDQADNTGAWAANPSFTVSAQQETAATAAGTWTATRSATAWGGATLSATVAGAALTFTSTANRFAVVGTVGPGRGGFQLLVDGQLRQTVATSSTTLTQRLLLATVSLATGQHTIRVQTTSAAPVEIDGLVTLR